MNDLHEILQRLSIGDYQTTLHARIRMSERNISDADVRCCGHNGLAILQTDGKIKIKGHDIDGEKLTIICVEEDDVLIITLY